MHPLIPQIVGVAALVPLVLSFQLKHRRQILFFNVLARCLCVLQYILLGAFAGAILDVLGAAAGAVAAKKDRPFIKRHLRLVIVLTDVLIVATGTALCILNKSALDIFPIIAVLLHTGAFWLTKERNIRLMTLFGSPFWFVYNLASRAYGSVASDLLMMGSILLALIRYRRKPSANAATEQIPASAEDPVAVGAPEDKE